MIDFATLQGLAIPEGVVTQIADAAGNVLWAVSGVGKVVLEVVKVTSDTYAAETLYEQEQFVLLNVYPTTYGTVKVTYGGLTKTITDTSGAAEPNAIQVFFGTFNGVSDSVATPASGELAIEGEYSHFSVGTYSHSTKVALAYCGCITAVVDFGNLEVIGDYAFRNCTALRSIVIPDSVTSIGDYAFYDCTALESISIGDGVTSIGNSAFCDCEALASVIFSASVKSIGDEAFKNCYGLQFGDSFLPSGLVSIGTKAFDLSSYGSNYPDIVNAIFTITIPSTVTSIGDYAFIGAVDGSRATPYFNRVMVLATTPPSCNDTDYYGIFGNYTNVTNLSILVPKGCGSAYKAASGWSYYANAITEV